MFSVSRSRSRLLHHLSALAAPSRSAPTRAASMAAVQLQRKPQYEQPAVFQPEVRAPAMTRHAPKERALRPSLPAPLYLDIDNKCRIEYIDVAPTGASDSPRLPSTLLMIHGAPGTYDDFKYAIHELSKRGVRVVGVNLPGSGGSRVFDRLNYYDVVAMDEAVRLVHQAVRRILDSEPHGRVFVLGHSFGGHAAVRLARLMGSRVDGLALLSSAGHRPHRVLWPAGNGFMVGLLRSKVPALERLSRYVTKLVYTRLFKFRPHGLPDSHYSNALVHTHSADYEQFARDLECVAVVPNYHARCKDDRTVEAEISEGVANVCRPGPRAVFDKGGHNPQKTHAATVAKGLVQFMRSVEDGSYDATYGGVATHLGLSKGDGQALGDGGRRSRNSQETAAYPTKLASHDL